MRKITINSLTSTISCFILMVSFLGFETGIQLFKEIVVLFNSILANYCDSNILDITLNHAITYSIVGMIFSIIGCPRGKTGHIIGKILYFLVGFVIGAVLDLISKLIF